LQADRLSEKASV
jgi:hypothetical protein